MLLNQHADPYREVRRKPFGVAAGPLGWRAQAAAAGQGGLDRWGGQPVRGAGVCCAGPAPGFGECADSGPGQVERAFVFSADGGVEQVAVAQIHLRDTRSSMISTDIRARGKWVVS